MKGKNQGKNEFMLIKFFLDDLPWIEPKGHKR